MLRVWTAVAAAGLVLLSWNRSISLQPHTERGVLAIDPPTPFFRFMPDGAPRGRVLVVHGLDVSKNIMQIFCAALADGGFEAVAIDLPGHGDSPAGFNALRARDAVAAAMDRLGNIDIVVGHSLGAGLLLDLANDREMPRMVLLSPPPTPLDGADLRRTLVVTGVWDIPAINEFVPSLEGAEWRRLPWAAHSSVIFNASQTRDIVRWMGGNDSNLHMSARLRWDVLMLISAIAFGLCLLPERSGNAVSSGLGIPETAGWFVLAGAGAVITLKFIPVMGWLHLFATDYLIGVFFLMGMALAVAAVYDRRFYGVWKRKTGGHRSPLQLTAVLAAAYTIGVIGFFAGGHFMHFALSDGRWWRFPAIGLASFPLFYFDELAIRATTGWKTAVQGILSRVLIGIAILMGVLTLNRDKAFLVLIVHLIVLFWTGLWFLTGAVRRHTQDPYAAALFACLVQGWMFAAWFVTI